MSRQVAEDATPIEDPAQLREYFLRGARPPSQWGHGIEYERIGVFAGSGETVPFAGHPSVESALQLLAEHHGWEAGEEGGHIIELQRGPTAVTLEPGAQLELVGAVHRELAPLQEELCGFVREMDEVSAPLGISWLAIGLNPFTPIERIGWIPKARYRIMSRRLARRGKLAHHMMKGTAGIQGNFDFGSEEDAMEKFRLAMGASSITTAVCANSPLYAGLPNQFRTMRSFIWLDTDPDRCGLLEIAFHPESGFQAYVDYALSVPMLFIVREGRWIDMDGYTFGRFLSEGRNGWRPKVTDWALHLTTLFPEARLKRYLEVRGADSVAPDMAVALMAWWKGLLYSPRALRAGWETVSELSWPERQQLHRDVCLHGLEATVRGRPVAHLAGDLLEIARQGLRDQREAGEVPDETSFLDPIARILREPASCPASRLLDLWNGAWKGERTRLVDHCAGFDRACP